MNIIPIIAKADTISKSELHKFKIKIMSELVSNGVQIYQFPTDDEAVAEINSVMNVGNAASPIPAPSPGHLNCCTKTQLKGSFIGNVQTLNLLESQAVGLTAVAYRIN